MPDWVSTEMKIILFLFLSIVRMKIRIYDVTVLRCQSYMNDALYHQFGTIFDRYSNWLHLRMPKHSIETAVTLPCGIVACSSCTSIQLLQPTANEQSTPHTVRKEIVLSIVGRCWTTDEPNVRICTLQ